MADAVFSFELEGNGDAALEQASALEQLRDRLTQGTAALRGMQSSLNAMKGSAHANGPAFKQLKDQIAAQKAALAGAHARFVELGGDFKNLKRPAVDAKAGFEQFLESARGSSGPLGRLVGGLEKLKGLGARGAMAAGLAGIGAALLALAAAATVATAALFKFGLAMADAVRAERLQLEGLTKIRNWWGLAADKAGFLQDTISKVSGQVALGRDQINGMATSLYKAGLRGGSLQHALEGVAIATAAAGEEQGEFYKAWFLGASRSSGATKKLADDIKARFGGVAKAQMLSLGVQAKKLRENFQQLFSGLRIERFLEALHDVTDLFSQNTFSGRALKTILETVFQPMVDFATGYGIYFKRFFQGLIIGAQLLVLGVLKLRNWFRKTFGDSEILKGIDKQKIAVYAGAFAVGALAGAFVGLAAAIAVVVAPFVYLAYRIAKFVKDVYDAYAAFRAIDWTAAGRALVDGIAAGIRNGAQWVISAVKNLGSQALKAFKEKLGIASPSRVFARLGVEMPRGAAVGIQAGAPQLTAATRRMANESSAAYEAAPPLTAAPVSPVVAPAAGGRRGAIVSPTLNLTINVAAPADGKTSTLVEDIRRVVREEIPAMFESVAIHLGAEVPA
jgi:hypothetical protein